MEKERPISIQCNRPKSGGGHNYDRAGMVEIHHIINHL
jgi:hypothetical protein